MTRPRLLLIAPAIALVSALGLGLTALAQDTSHDGHAMMGDKGPSSMAYMDAQHPDARGMAIEFTGNADVDFIRGMIPHHQGAVDMAKIVLEHGTDPEVRKLAEGVIAAQEAEIAWMQDWLAKNGG